MRKTVLACLVASIGAIGCAGSGSNAPATGSAPPSAPARLSNAEIERARSVHAQALRTGKVYTAAENPVAAQYLSRVVNNIARQRPPGAVPLQGFIIKDDDVNAFTTGAGYLYFNRGLLAALQNEAQLAMIVGHEAAHVDAGHIAQGINEQATVDTLTSIGVAILQSSGVGGLAAPLGELGVGLVGQRANAYFSQGHELEADDIGLRYTIAAGYDGLQAASAFRVLTMANGSRGRLAEFFSSHPSSEGRLRTVAARAAASGQTGGYIGAAEYAQMVGTLTRSGR